MHRQLRDRGGGRRHHPDRHRRRGHGDCSVHPRVHHLRRLQEEEEDGGEDPAFHGNIKNYFCL